MLLTLFLRISCSLLVATTGQCSNTALTSTQFKTLNVTYNGCNDTSVPSTTKRSLLDCALSCLNSKDCVYFTYTKTNNTCRNCNAVKVKGLVFDGGSGTVGTGYTLRQGILPTQLLSPTSEFLNLNLPCGLLIGNVVVLRAVCLNTTELIINIQENDNNISLHLHYSIRKSLIMSPLGFNYRSNGAWGAEYVPAYSTFPFTAGKEFNLSILMGGTGFVIFIDGKRFCNFTYVVPITIVRYVNVFGAIQPLELSV